MLQCSLFEEGRAYNAIFLAGAAGDEFASLTDPQTEKYADYYASGGRAQSEKNQPTAKKYSSMGENAPPPFERDAKDQCSWTRSAARIGR